jgi:hypothetical protein
MQTQPEAKINEILNNSLNRAVSKHWITADQAHLIRLGDLIDSIAHQVQKLMEYMSKEEALSAVWKYHMSTVFNSSDSEIVKLISDEVDKILQ